MLADHARLNREALCLKASELFADDAWPRYWGRAHGWEVMRMKMIKLKKSVARFIPAVSLVAVVVTIGAGAKWG